MDVPGAEPDEYIGFVGGDDIELRIYGESMEMWDADSQTQIAYHDFGSSSAGLHNIGLRAGYDAGVWLNGSRVMWAGAPLGIYLPVRFGA